MKRLRTSVSEFAQEFALLLQRGRMDIDTVESVVRGLLKEIKERGDAALIQHVGKFDRWRPENAEALKMPVGILRESYEALDSDTKEALELAYRRIRSFHEKQKPKSWLDFEPSGTVLGQKVTPVDKAGLYIPGGKAAYPSSLLMNAIPAIVAGVDEIVVCTPTPDNDPHPLLLAACHLCGITEVFKVGGASAVGAMAYGTRSIPKVDVITGPGNIYVATAKKLVYGEVNIDMIAGPSEIVILADKDANPEYIAIDMLSQAEHDEMASSILITDSEEMADRVHDAVYRRLELLKRKEIAKISIVERGAIIVCDSMDKCCACMNQIAPEHLEVLTANPFDLLPKIKHAGAIFLGENTPEPIGDYVAGPNHTLPTGGTAKFYSPLSTGHFMKKSSILSFSAEGLQEVGEACAKIAGMEGLEAHELSVRDRLK